MKAFYSSKCLDYWQEGHPENPARVRETAKLLRNIMEFVEPKTCDEDLLLVHDKELLERIKNNEFVDRDTPVIPDIFEYAKLAAGSAVDAMDYSLHGERAFSLMRPPGHHAGRRFLGGFCYMNNIAIAVNAALEKTDKVAILDIDGHHGNGTQDIFYGNEAVLYVSLHQKNAFPMTGFISEGNCINYPLLPGTNDDEYMKKLKSAVRKIIDFKPDLLAISAGFDTYKGDMLLDLNLTKEVFMRIGLLISTVEVPIFAVLEGGYSKDLPHCVSEFLKGLEK